jgi:hypothetical protein
MGFLARVGLSRGRTGEDEGLGRVSKEPAKRVGTGVAVMAEMAVMVLVSYAESVNILPGAMLHYREVQRGV